MNTVEVRCVQNGFIVVPVVNSMSDANPETICVFETHEAMFAYFKVQFPITIKAEIQGD